MNEFGDRYDPNVLKELRLNPNQRERARLALKVIDLALDELGFSGNPPKFVCGVDSRINGLPQTGGFIHDWEEGGGGPAIMINVGDSMPFRKFGDDLIKHMLSGGWSYDRIGKLAIVDIGFEETFHFWEYTQGLLPSNVGPTGLLPEYNDHDSMPHEIRAREFAESMTALHFDHLVAGLRNLFPRPILFR